MDILDRKSEEVVSFFSALDNVMDAISQMLKNRDALTNNNRFLTTKEVCRLLHISPRTLQTWRDTGKILFIRINGKVLYDQKKIIQSIKEMSS